MSRLYYDSQNPQLLTDEQIGRLSNREAAACCEQIDQNILSVLQEIDENFVSSTRTVTDKLIPAVEGYGRSSKLIWDSVKVGCKQNFLARTLCEQAEFTYPLDQLWKTFFEAAAGIRLAEPGSLPSPLAQINNDEEGQYISNGADNEADVTARLGNAHGQQVKDARFHSPSSDEDSSSEVSTPNTTVRGRSKTPESPVAIKAKLNLEPEERIVKSKDIDMKQNEGSNLPEPSWADQESPFERLQQDMQKAHLESESPYSAASFSMPQAPAIAPSSLAAAAANAKYRAQTRLRDLSMDSPDFDRPALETMSFQHPRDKAYKDQLVESRHLSHQSGRKTPTSYDEYQNHAGHSSTFFKEASEGPSTVSTPAFSENSTSFNLSPPEPGTSGAAHRPLQPSLSRRQSGASQILLQKVLIKNLVRKDGRPNASTPARKSVRDTALPDDLPKQWNGIADLSTTPLTSFDSPQKPSSIMIQPVPKIGQTRTRKSQPGAPIPYSSCSSPSNSSLILNMTANIDDKSYARSFAMQNYDPPAFSVSKTRLTKTPAKEAARLITRVVLHRAALRNGAALEDIGAESPMLDPPSVVKNWATRGYTGNIQQKHPGNALARSPSKSIHSVPRSTEDTRQRGFEKNNFQHAGDDEESFEAEFEPYEHEDAPPSQPDFGHLADSGERAHERGEGIADDWDDSFEGEGASIDKEMKAGDGLFEETDIPISGDPGQDYYAEQSFENSSSFDEETVFGAKAAARSSYAPPGSAYEMHQEDGLHPMLGDSAFQLRGPGADDMVTLHGGRLLESQPFEASPLAGRDARYGL